MDTTSLQLIIDKILALIPIILQVVGSFALVATVTKNKVDDKILQIIMDVVNFLGANLGRAKNSDNA